MSEQDVMTGTLEVGTVLQGRYVIEEIIGQGGFGITYRAKDTRVDVPVAVKEYIPQRQLSEKEAERETKLAAKFYDLEGVAAARDYFTEGNHFYIVMEYVKGISVKQYISQQGRMNGKETLEKMRPILESVAKIHAEGVVHRDISADNLMITEGNKLKLVDFGTARFTEEYVDKTHTLIFKRGFAPVEQYRSRGKQGPWTDIYSLCATMYFMITGMLPDDAVERMIDDRTKSLQLVHGTGLTEEEADCIMKGLSVRPEDRYQNIGEFYESLYKKAWHEGLKTIKVEKSEKVRTPVSHTGFSTTALLSEIRGMGKKEKSKKKILWIVLLLICAITGGVLVWKVASRKNTVNPKRLSTTTAEVTPTMSASPTAFPTKEPVEEAGYQIKDYVGLTKKQLKDKTKELRKAGLKIKYKYKFSDNVASGKIISQKPRKGKEYKDVSDVSLVVTLSRGAKPTMTPKPTKIPRVTPVPTKKPKTKKENDIDFSGDLDKILG